MTDNELLEKQYPVFLEFKLFYNENPGYFILTTLPNINYPSQPHVRKEVRPSIL